MPIKFLIEKGKWALLFFVLFLVFILVFRREIADRILNVNDISIGDKTIHLNNPSSGDIETILRALIGENDGVVSAYLRARLADRAEELRSMRKGELIVSSPATTFAELLRLAQETRRDIYSINHRPQVWADTKSPLSYTYSEYLKENENALKRGVQIHRLIVIAEGRSLDERTRRILRTHKAAGVDIRYAFLSDLEKTPVYRDLRAAYDGRKLGCSFSETNMALYDRQVLVHTLAYDPGAFGYPTKLRIAWSEEDVKKIDLSLLFQGVQGVREFKE